MSRFLRNALRRILLVVGATVVVLGLWWVFLVAAGISPFIGKTPVDVVTYLFTGPEAVANRTLITENILITLGDAGVRLRGRTPGRRGDRGRLRAAAARRDDVHAPWRWCCGRSPSSR